MSTHLHFYQCSFCKATATSPVLVKTFIKCNACGRLLRYLWSEAITDDRLRDLAKRGLVFNPFTTPPTPPSDPVLRCHHRGCHVYAPKSTMLDGLFCSQVCADKDAAEMLALKERLEALYSRRPDLRPKESVHG
jgi:hypothetical protein